MRSKSLLAAAVVAPLALAIGTAANASTNLVQNGGFETSSYSQSSQFGGTGSSFAYGGQGVANWTGNAGYEIWFKGGTQTTTNALNYWDSIHPGTGYGNYFRGLTNSVYPTETGAAYNVVASPNGGSFVAIDGDPLGNGSISQTISGLTVGQKYTLTFDWAAAQLINKNQTYQVQLTVDFGTASQQTANLVEGPGKFSGWQSETMSFTATKATQTLTFLANGHPTGQPPVALLDGVSLTAVPEPASWAMMILGFGAIGLMMRRRSQSLVLAA
jgi:hypothetical protein